MLIVSSGEFRANQKAYLDKVDDGQEVRAEDFAKEPDEDLEGPFRARSSNGGY